MKYAIIVYTVSAFYMWMIIKGLAFAYFQNKFPILSEKYRKEDYFFSILWSVPMAVVWPIGIIIVSELTEKAKYGWRRPTLRQI